MGGGGGEGGGLGELGKIWRQNKICLRFRVTCHTYWTLIRYFWHICMSLFFPNNDNLWGIVWRRSVLNTANNVYYFISPSVIVWQKIKTVHYPDAFIKIPAYDNYMSQEILWQGVLTNYCVIEIREELFVTKRLKHLISVICFIDIGKN